MVSLNELCKNTARLSTATAALRHACALPRSPADMCPLPEPHAELPFDSSWETLFSGTDRVGKPDE